MTKPIKTECTANGNLIGKSDESTVEYLVAHDGSILTTEGYLTYVFNALGLLKDDEDSVEVCGVASNEGFVNLGDFGNGFVFYFPVDGEMADELKQYFEGE